AAVLVVCAGPSIRRAGEQMHGIGRDIVLGIGRPAAWVADQLPFHHAAHSFTAWLSPDANLNGPGGFTNAASTATGASAGAAAAGKQVDCCGAQWAAIYAQRARQMMNTYRQAGAAHVYWLTLPIPRDSLRAKIATVVNAAIEVAAEPWRDQVTIVDTIPVFTP